MYFTYRYDLEALWSMWYVNSFLSYIKGHSTIYLIESLWEVQECLSTISFDFVNNSVNLIHSWISVEWCWQNPNWCLGIRLLLNSIDFNHLRNNFSNSFDIIGSKLISLIKLVPVLAMFHWLGKWPNHSIASNNIEIRSCHSFQRPVTKSNPGVFPGFRFLLIVNFT